MAKKARSPSFADSVFINCPFDHPYAPILEAIVFCVVDCGFVPRSALEQIDSGDLRLNRIRRLIQGSLYAIHDISRIAVTRSSPFPRFNMPFELGLDLGCRFYGADQLSSKRCLILDEKQYRYQKVLSDIAGQDIRAHNNSPDRAITVVREWLRNASGRTTLPGPNHIKSHFRSFARVLPDYADRSGLDRNDLQFADYVLLIEEWLKTTGPA
jgi:hypothetical protein